MNDFERMLAEGRIAVIDVRTPEEYAAGHIPGALSIPVEELEARAAEVRSFRRPIVAYCSCLAEESSLTAVATLSRLGVKGARALTGGYQTWALTGRRVVIGANPL
jgi:rhodanese-related sulfurtransferase